MNNDVDILRIAKDHWLAPQASDPYPLPNFLSYDSWSRLAVNAAEAIGAFTSVSDAIHYAQDHGRSGFNHRASADMDNLQRHMHHFWSRFPGAELVSESPHSLPASLGFVHGTWISNILFWHLEAYYVSSGSQCHAQTRVLEIGGGCGELARIYQVKLPDLPYTIVDIATSLFFAEVYLRASGIEVHHAVTQNTPPQSGVWLVPVPLYKCTFGIQHDLIISQASFQHMLPEVVTFWLACLSAWDTKAVYSLNYGRRQPELLAPWRLVMDIANPMPAALNATSDFVERMWVRDS